MKKLVSLMLAVVMVFALAACGKEPAETDPAAKYPERTVTVVVPFAAGSGSHALAVAAQNALQSKVTMAVTNVEGGGGSVGAMEVYHATADGYTMLCSTIENVAAGRVNGTYQEADAWEKMRCVAVVGGCPQIMIASKASGLTTLQEVIDYAKANPGKLTVSGATANSYTNAMALLIIKQLGVDIRWVSYDSVTNASKDCMAGKIDLCIYGSDNAASPVASGDCVPIAMLSATRSSFYPDLPTAAEQCPDLCKDFDYWIYRTFFMPPETPTAVADKMSEMLKALGEDAGFKDVLTAQKLEFSYKNRTETEKALKARAEEAVQMYDLLKKSGN